MPWHIFLTFGSNTDVTHVDSFDEGIASRVPYESAARVLPQSKRSFAGYTVRQGYAELWSV